MTIKTNPLPFHPKASIIDDILKEVKRAKKKHPDWPDHIVARAAIVAEEAGELIKASLQWKYEPAEGIQLQRQREELYTEAIQTAAMCIRFIENLPFLNSHIKTHHDSTAKPAENLISEDSEREG